MPAPLAIPMASAVTTYGLPALIAAGIISKETGSWLEKNPDFDFSKTAIDLLSPGGIGTAIYDSLFGSSTPDAVQKDLAKEISPTQVTKLETLKGYPATISPASQEQKDALTPYVDNGVYQIQADGSYKLVPENALKNEATKTEVQRLQGVAPTTGQVGELDSPVIGSPANVGKVGDILTAQGIDSAPGLFKDAPVAAPAFSHRSFQPSDTAEGLTPDVTPTVANINNRAFQPSDTAPGLFADTVPQVADVSHRAFQPSDTAPGLFADNIPQAANVSHRDFQPSDAVGGATQDITPTVADVSHRAFQPSDTIPGGAGSPTIGGPIPDISGALAQDKLNTLPGLAAPHSIPGGTDNPESGYQTASYDDILGAIKNAKNEENLFDVKKRHVSSWNPELEAALNKQSGVLASRQTPFGGIFADNEESATTVTTKKADGTTVTIKSPEGTTLKKSGLFGVDDFKEDTSADLNKAGYDSFGKRTQRLADRPLPPSITNTLPGSPVSPIDNTDFAAATGQSTGPNTPPPGLDQEGGVAQGINEADDAELANETPEDKQAKFTGVSNKVNEILQTQGPKAAGGFLQNLGSNAAGFSSQEKRALIMAGLQLLGGAGINSAVSTMQSGFAASDKAKATTDQLKRTAIERFRTQANNATLTIDGKRFKFSELNTVDQQKLMDTLVNSYATDPDKFNKITSELGIKGFNATAGGSKLTDAYNMELIKAKGKSDAKYAEYAQGYNENQAIATQGLSGAVIDRKFSKGEEANQYYSSGGDNKKFRPIKVPSEGIGRAAPGANNFLASDTLMDGLKQAFYVDDNGEIAIDRSKAFWANMPWSESQSIKPAVLYANLMEAAGITGLAGVENLTQLFEKAGGAPGFFTNSKTAVNWMAKTLDYSSQLAFDHSANGTKLSPAALYITRFNDKYGSGGGKAFIKNVLTSNVDQSKIAFTKDGRAYTVVGNQIQWLDGK